MSAHVRVDEMKDGPATILVPVDFSSNSKSALCFAARVAQDVGAALTVVHVVHTPSDQPDFYSRGAEGDVITPLEDRAAKMMRAFLAETAEAADSSSAVEGANVEMIVGLPVSRILEFEKTVEPMLLVMGSRGMTGLKRLLLGSTAEQVARRCRAPILIVKNSGDGS